MKQLLFFVLLIFITLPACAQSKSREVGLRTNTNDSGTPVPIPTQKTLREVDLHVNGVGSGTSYSTVVGKLGKPLRSKKEKYAAENACSGEAETHLTLFYSGLEITLLGDGSGRDLEVYSIEVMSGNWSASGVTIGANAADVLTKFGEPNSKEEKSGETIFHYVTKENLGGVNFYFRDNKLVRVRLNETLC